MRARTGLWEPWVSNHPGPPGPFLRGLGSELPRLLKANLTPLTSSGVTVDRISFSALGRLVTTND